MKDFFDLYKLYLKINRMGWVKSKRKGPGGIGYTFETLLGKEEDDFQIPDFKSIEIKTMRFFSKRTLHLFTLTPDGDFLFPIKRLLDTIGYPSKFDVSCKIFQANANACEYSMVGLSKKIRLNVNYEKQKVELLAFKSSGQKIDVNISWSFELLEKTLESKLKNLAIVMAKHKVLNNEEYFHYSKIIFYKIRDFDTFISLIEKGIITIIFNIDVFKSGKRIGQVHDHGTGFCINLNNVDSLYKKIILDV